MSGDEPSPELCASNAASSGIKILKSFWPSSNLNATFESFTSSNSVSKMSFGAVSRSSILASNSDSAWAALSNSALKPCAKLVIVSLVNPEISPTFESTALILLSK